MITVDIYLYEIKLKPINFRQFFIIFRLLDDLSL